MCSIHALPPVFLFHADFSSLLFCCCPSWRLGIYGDTCDLCLLTSPHLSCSAAASPQFSATGSTPSHKKANLPGRAPFPVCRNCAQLLQGAQQISAPHHIDHLRRRQFNEMSQKWAPERLALGKSEHRARAAHKKYTCYAITPNSHHHCPCVPDTTLLCG